MPRDDDDYRRSRRRDDDDDDDRPRRRRREDDDDDDDDYPRRRRRRDDDYDDDDEDRYRISRGRRRDEEDVLSSTEWLLYTLLFICVPCANVLISSILYYVWRGTQPRRANQINMLGFIIFGANVVLGCLLGALFRGR